MTIDEIAGEPEGTIRCRGCHRPFDNGARYHIVIGFIYCLSCAADIENARRCD